MEPETIEFISKIIEFFNTCVPVVEKVHNYVRSSKYRQNRRYKPNVIFVKI